MLVEVLMTSCQVSLKPKIGPVSPQTTRTSTAMMKVTGLPAHRDTACDTRVKNGRGARPDSTLRRSSRMSS